MEAPPDARNVEGLDRAGVSMRHGANEPAFGRRSRVQGSSPRMRVRPMGAEVIVLMSECRHGYSR